MYVPRISNAIPQRYRNRCRSLTFSAVAEKTFLNLKALAASNPTISFLAVSHSDEPATKTWLESVGGKGDTEVIVDYERKIYAAWGLGPSSLWHVLNPTALMGAVNVGREDGIWNKPTQSGSRWQTAGSFAVNGNGEVVWGRPSKQADDLPSLEDGLSAVKKG